jgi:hypothetical protein
MLPYLGTVHCHLGCIEDEPGGFEKAKRALKDLGAKSVFDGFVYNYSPEGSTFSRTTKNTRTSQPCIRPMKVLNWFSRRKAD